MSNSIMIKVTNNSTDFGGSGNWIFSGVRADSIVYLTLFEASIVMDTDARVDLIRSIKVVDNGTVREFALGTAQNQVARIQMGNLGRGGNFYTILDSQDG